MTRFQMPDHTRGAGARRCWRGVAGVLAEANAAPGDIAVLLHATTLGFQRPDRAQGRGYCSDLYKRLPATCCGSAGEKKFDIYDLQIERPAPLVPDQLSFEVDERVGPDGVVIDRVGRAIGDGCRRRHQGGRGRGG